MEFTKLVPSVFYEDIHKGLKLFVDCLGFTISYSELETEAPYCVLAKELGILLFENAEYAAKEKPELRLVTPDIEAVYKQVSKTHPELLHPNLSQITLRPWGAKEFALKDGQVGIIFQEWP